MPRNSLVLAALAVAWLAAVGVGQRWLLTYEDAPGTAGDRPADWPADSAIGRTPGHFTLLLFGHPHCPCTRASLEELSLVLARSQGKADAVVVFVLPPGAADGWERTDLWRRAAAIPGVRPVIDGGGAEARRFGAKTSGQALLFDPNGRLLFRGGLTAARGHQGDNAGRRAVLAWLTGGAAAGADAPVYGCPLFDEDSP